MALSWRQTRSCSEIFILKKTRVPALLEHGERLMNEQFRAVLCPHHFRKFTFNQISLRKRTMNHLSIALSVFSLVEWLRQKYYYFK